MWPTIGSPGHQHLKLKSPRETLENPASLRENGVVIAGQDWVDGRQAARIHGL